MQPLSLYYFAISLGIIWGIIVLLFGLYSMKTKQGESIIKIASAIYFGYKPTILGSIYGALWGFLDGVISGTIIAFIYNKIMGY